jgi:aspartyl aminopeptidase
MAWSSKCQIRERNQSPAGSTAHARCAARHPFEPVDIGKQIKAMLAEFAGNPELHRCKKCGAAMDVK